MRCGTSWPSCAPCTPSWPRPCARPGPSRPRCAPGRPRPRPGSGGPPGGARRAAAAGVAVPLRSLGCAACSASRLLVSYSGSRRAVRRRAEPRAHPAGAARARWRRCSSSGTRCCSRCAGWPARGRDRGRRPGRRRARAAPAGRAADRAARGAGRRPAGRGAQCPDRPAAVVGAAHRSGLRRPVGGVVGAHRGSRLGARPARSCWSPARGWAARWRRSTRCAGCTRTRRCSSRRPRPSPARSRRWPGPSLAHLACHGRLRADNPSFSALELVDGQLTVHELDRRGHRAAAGGAGRLRLGGRRQLRR